MYEIGQSVKFCTERISGIPISTCRHPVGVAFVGCAAVMYFPGGLAVTVVDYIPLNEACALIDARALGQGADQVWQMYSSDWTPLNTLRTAVCLPAMTKIALARYDTKA